MDMFVTSAWLLHTVHKSQCHLVSHKHIQLSFVSLQLKHTQEGSKSLKDMSEISWDPEPARKWSHRGSDFDPGTRIDTPEQSNRHSLLRNWAVPSGLLPHQNAAPAPRRAGWEPRATCPWRGGAGLSCWPLQLPGGSVPVGTSVLCLWEQALSLPMASVFSPGPPSKTRLLFAS